MLFYGLPYLAKANRSLGLGLDLHALFLQAYILFILQNLKIRIDNIKNRSKPHRVIIILI